MENKIRIMFVCMGNICRSPLAHAVFEDIVKTNHAETAFDIESSGTISYHAGELPDARMRETAIRHGIAMTHRARQLKRTDLDDYDIILAMDKENLANIRKLAKNNDQLKKIQLFRHFDPEATANAEVPDPYYGGSEGFENVYRIVERTANALFLSLRK